MALGLVLASMIGGWAFVKGKRGDQTIVVTGSARKRIRSDLVIWRASVTYQAAALADAYRSISESVPPCKVIPADSNEVSGTGMNDTSSLEKDITAVVNVGFAVDRSDQKQPNTWVHNGNC